MKKYIGIVITISTLFLFALYFINNVDSFRFITNIPITYTLAIAFLNFIIIYLNGLFLQLILREFNINTGHLENFYGAVITYIGNYFIPMRGGASLRAIFLKRKYKFQYSYFVSILSGTYVITFLLLSLVSLFAMSIIHILTGHYSITLYVFFLIIFCISVIFIQDIRLDKATSLLRKRLIGKTKIFDRVIQVISDIYKGFSFIKKNKKLLFLLFSLTLLNIVLTLLITYFEFKIINVNLSFIRLLLYTCLSGMSLLISITPGSIGIRESIFIVFSSIIGITNDQILQVAVVDRSIVYILLVILFVTMRVLFLFKKI